MRDVRRANCLRCALSAPAATRARGSQSLGQGFGFVIGALPIRSAQTGTAGPELKGGPPLLMQPVVRQRYRRVRCLGREPPEAPPLLPSGRWSTVALRQFLAY